MTRTFILSILILFVYGCNRSNSIKRENEPLILTVESADVAMNKAIEKANQTLPEFYKALESQNKDYYGFGLKMIFKASDRNEHIWINGLFKKNNEYFGVVDNLPEFTNEVKQGDTIKIDSNRISDWMYLDNEKLRGGFTIRILREKMTQEEREEFDKTSGMIIK